MPIAPAWRASPAPSRHDRIAALQHLIRYHGAIPTRSPEPSAPADPPRPTSGARPHTPIGEDPPGPHHRLSPSWPSPSSCCARAGCSPAAPPGCPSSSSTSVGWRLGLVLFLVNLPFYVFGLAALASVSPSRPSARWAPCRCSPRSSPALVHFDHLDPVFAAVMAACWPASAS